MEKNKHDNLLLNPDRRNFDIVTDMPLRRTFWKMADEKVLKDNREYCLLMTDVENFHLLNRWYGRDVGDELLIRIGMFLKNVDREYGSFSGYLGGDNFATVYPSSDELTEVIRQGLIKIIFEFKSQDIFRALFSGIKTANKDITVAELCDYAYIALETAKDKLEQEVCWYDASMSKEQDIEIELMPKVRNAMLNNEITFYLQPKCVLQTGKIVGAEALIRWISPDEGMIPPCEFIPVLEKNGFINQLDKYVWEEVCKTISRWQKEGRRILPVSVNVSRVDIYSMNVVEIFKDLIEKYEISPQSLEIEITESAYVENGAVIKETEEALKEAGFKILIDDFGSGYSSLNMLKDVDADVLKLDMKFLDLNIHNNGKGVNIISAVLNMAHQLDLPTIAEGIESVEQLEVLEMLGCEYAQGYYYYKPMPISEFEKLLDDDDKIADNTSVSHKKKHDKSYLQELTEYFWKVADVNPFTGEYHFIRNVSEPDFISTPRPETMSEYAERYVNHGLIHPDDADVYMEVNNLDYVLEELKKGKKRSRYQMRYLISGRYQWCTFEMTRPDSFSEEDPWVLYSWKIADDDAGDTMDTLEIVSNEFLKVIKVYFDTDTYDVIKAMNSDVIRKRSGYESFSAWTKEHVDDNLIHPDDLKKYVEFLDVNRLKEYFLNNEEPLTFRFRRKMDDQYKWVELTLSRSKDYSEVYQAAMLYLKEVGAFLPETNEERKKNLIMSDDIWGASEYSAVINLTDNVINQYSSRNDSHDAKDIIGAEFTKYAEYLSEKYLLPEYREIYKNFINPDRLIGQFENGNQIESLDYKQIYKSQERWLRVIMFLYKEKSKDNIYARMLVHDIDKTKRQETEIMHKYNNVLTKELADANFKYEIQAQLSSVHRDPEAINTALGMVGKFLDADSTFILSVKGDKMDKMYDYPKWGGLQKELLSKHMPPSVDAMKNSFKNRRARYYYLADETEFATLEAIGFNNIVGLPVYDNRDEFLGVIGVINAHKTIINEELLRSVALIFFIALQNIEAYEMINMMGTMDILTGLKNRNSYEMDLETYFGGKYRNIACIYIDANGLHELNNEKGHDAGDKMLKTVADTIKNTFGSEKTYRIGGDEFVIIITDSDEDYIEPRLLSLAATLEKEDYHVSAGYSWTDDLSQFTAVIRKAEQKMYENKREYYRIHGGRRSSDR